MGRMTVAVKVAAFTALYVLAALVGRATVVGNRDLSLVWPAAGIAVVWFLTLTTRRSIAWSAVLLAAATVSVNLFTRSSSGPTAPLIVANLVQVAAVVLLVRHWCPELGLRGGRPPLESPRSLVRFLLAVTLGCLAAVVAGSAMLAVSDSPASAMTALTWWGRNIFGVLGIGITGLLLVDRLTRDPAAAPRTPGGRVEAAALVTITVALVGSDAVTGLPLIFLLPGATVWAALRFSPLAVSAHALLGGVAVIWLTLIGEGLFATSVNQQAEVLLAQAFVGSTMLTGLLLAASRRESAELHRKLEERQRELAAFSRRAAHDLQNPLMVIDGWTRLLADRLEGTERDMAVKVANASTQMRQLVTDLLADATARDRELDVSPVDLAVLARDVAEAHAAADFVRIGHVPLVMGDPAMMRQLLDNLISNALKYVAPGKRPDIEIVGTWRGDGTVSIAVADRGVGIPEGSHEHVFGDFVRLHGDDYPGTGLGLSICRRIVDRHGGEIVAAPRPLGSGTVFSIRLPAWQHLPHQRSPRQSPAATLERQQPWSPTMSPL